MSNKYCDPSATYDGDGTASTAAASAGAAGAWNNLNNVFKCTPAYGSLAAGDIIYVRSHDGTNPITYTGGTTNITMGTTGTAAAPIQMIIDNGTVWSTGGQLTYSIGGTSNTTVFNAKPYFHISGNINFNFLYTGSGNYTPIVFSQAVYNNISFNITANNNNLTGSSGLIVAESNTNPKIINLTATCGRIGTQGLITSNDQATVELINPQLNVTGAYSGSVIFKVVGVNSHGGSITCIGGKITGGVGTMFLSLPATGFRNDIVLIGLDYGLIQTVPSAYSATAPMTGECYYSHLNANYHGGLITNLGSIDWTSGLNYPTLNAVLENTSTPWSYKVYPGATDRGLPIRLPMITKEYTQTAATKTITIEFLASTAFTNIYKDQVWVDVVYIDDSTGDTKIASTFALGNVSATTSTAGWSATIYGAINYNKYKVSITTPTSIKQNTVIAAVVHIGLPPQTVNDFFFVDPELSLT